MRINPKWEVMYIHWTAYAGMGGERNRETPDERTQHWTWLGADFYRRFRYRAFSMGMRGVQTSIVRTSERRVWVDGDPQTWEMSKAPAYSVIFEKYVWPAFYFVRNRWDGLRYGRDRDARAW